MKTITAPTTRRLFYGPTHHQFAGNVLIELDQPRLALYEYGSTPYSDRPYDVLCFAAHSERDSAILRDFDYGDLVGRFGSRTRYRASLAGIHALLDALGWQLTADERALIDALDSYGVSQVKAA